MTGQKGGDVMTAIASDKLAVTQDKPLAGEIIGAVMTEQATLIQPTV